MQSQEIGLSSNSSGLFQFMHAIYQPKKLQINEVYDFQKRQLVLTKNQQGFPITSDEELQFWSHAARSS